MQLFMSKIHQVSLPLLEFECCVDGLSVLFFADELLAMVEEETLEFGEDVMVLRNDLEVALGDDPVTVLELRAVAVDSHVGGHHVRNDVREGVLNVDSDSIHMDGHIRWKVDVGVLEHGEEACFYVG